ncbi:hypothetical protein MKW94_013712 [Papaver nudicaule]|uniref:Conserved oligomeric Golgi complex subunit 8 n=1 Tax=Papaver nudicaule TaxID=74823 RepID=A0AA41SH25_PAPNU|nr:hypothetical protein [Papaver nudicaule]
MEVAVTVGQDKKINAYSISSGKLLKTFKQHGSFGEPIKVTLDPSSSYLDLSLMSENGESELKSSMSENGEPEHNSSLLVMQARILLFFRVLRGGDIILATEKECMVDCFRMYLFGVVNQYRAIFAGDKSGSKTMMVGCCLVGLLCSWAVHKIISLLKTLKTVLPKILLRAGHCQIRVYILDQCMVTKFPP